MRIRPYIPLAVILLAGALCLSCKKDDDDTTTLDAFTGTLGFTMPEYVLHGDVFHIAPSGLSRDDAYPDRIGYYYKETLLEVTDTLRKEKDPASVTPEFDYTIAKDTIGTFTLTVYAFAAGYSQRSAARTSTSWTRGSTWARSRALTFPQPR